MAIGGGYADYEQSTTEIDGQPNKASRELARGVFNFGAGVDVWAWRWVALGGEARDFYSGSANYNELRSRGGSKTCSPEGPSCSDGAKVIPVVLDRASDFFADASSAVDSISMRYDT